MTIHLADATPLLPVCLLSLSLPPPPSPHSWTLLFAHGRESVPFHFSTVRFIGGYQAYRRGAGARCVSPDFLPLTKDKINPTVKMVVWVQNGGRGTKLAGP